MILIILIFIATLFCLCVVEYEFVVIRTGQIIFLLCMVKLAKVYHMYRFCVYIRKGKQECNGKIVSLSNVMQK